MPEAVREVPTGMERQPPVAENDVQGVLIASEEPRAEAPCLGDQRSVQAVLAYRARVEDDHAGIEVTLLPFDAQKLSVIGEEGEPILDAGDIRRPEIGARKWAQVVED